MSRQAAQAAEEAEEESKGLDNLVMMPPSITRKTAFLVLTFYEYDVEQAPFACVTTPSPCVFCATLSTGRRACREWTRMARILLSRCHSPATSP